MKIKFVKARIIKLLKTSLQAGFIFILCAIPVIAQEATPSAVPEEIIKKVKESLEQVNQDTFEEVKEAINENQVYARNGTIKDIKEDYLTIDLWEIAEEAEIKVASDAAILKSNPGKPRQTITLDDLKKEDFIIAMGFVSQGEKFLAKRIVVSPTPLPAPSRGLIDGKAIEIDDNKLTIQKNGEKETLTIDKKTKIKINNQEDGEPSIEDIQLEDRVAAIYTIVDGEIDSVKVILVIPGKNNPESSENEVAE